MLGERLDNRMRHLSKWARKQSITCFRLYERDIPDFPMIVDWYGDSSGTSGDAVAWFFNRTKDDTPEREREYRKHAEAEILAGLAIPPSRLFIKHRGRQRSEDGGRDQYERIDSRGVVQVVQEHGMKFEINLTDYLDVGLFLDHRPTRLAMQQRAQGKRVLNLFAYTGAFSVHAIGGGATHTKTVDMSKTYLEWYARNLALNGFAQSDAHEIVHADCLQWLEAGPPADERYDIVICDPPTFSNSKRMRADSFSVDRDYGELLQWISRFVAPAGEVFFSTNSRGFEFDPTQVPTGFGCHEISHRSVPEDFRNRKIHRCWRLAEGWKPRERKTSFEIDRSE
ncbi:MAG: SAM-dependent methyltransferase [Phycisphaerales bacterium]|nr:SAM-dependent methyltransferase [Phycisphaerales bacterium]